METWWRSAIVCNAARQQNYPRIQILTIEDLLNGKAIDMPKSIPSQFKQAEKVMKSEGKQLGF